MGYSVASYTSPHLLAYNERVKLNLEAVSDSALCQAFERVEQAREDEKLTYFEFGTLAALLLIHELQPDYAILEIGLGGRLDAVNIIDPDLAHITPIGLDHQQWLGSDLEQIGAEKAGILRDGVLAVCNDRNPPKSVVTTLNERNCRTMSIGSEYDFRWLDDQHIEWQDAQRTLALALPLDGRHQGHNLSGVMGGLSLLGELENHSDTEISDGFQQTTCPGRLQAVGFAGAARMLVDVGHNTEAAQMLAEYLKQNREGGRVTVLLGMLEDKNNQAFVQALAPQVDDWWLLSLPTPRGLSTSQLSQRIQFVAPGSRLFDTAEDALLHAMATLNNHDILLVTGSFLTVEAVMKSSFIRAC
jgi:dihydrofolate synthase/folylpolyglutamate synthase